MTFLRVALVALLVISAASGCGLMEPKKPEKPASAALRAEWMNEISALELRERLKDYNQRFFAHLTSASNRIRASTDDTAILRNTVYWQLLALPIVAKNLYEQGPLGTLVDNWSFTVQMRHYFESGDGQNLFNKHTIFAFETCETLEKDIEGVAKATIPAQQFEQMRTVIHDWSSRHPIKGPFGRHSARPDMIQASDANELKWIAQVPLSPWKSLDDTTAAIQEIKVTAEYFSDLALALPILVRLQTELLLYQAEDQPLVRSMVESSKDLSDSAVSMAASIEKLPDEMRETITATFEEIDTRQDGFQRTLEETRATLTEVRTALAEGKEIARSAEQATQNWTEAGSRWEAAVKEVNQLMDGFRDEPEPSDGPAREPQESAPFDINDYTRTATEARTAVAEARGLTADLNQLLDSVSSLGATVAWSGSILIVVFFGSLVAYRRLGKPTGKSDSTSQ